ncbi:MAG TPA: RDD family protein [Bryobacteraceae bacterium]|nr:RDD family protein [Bryobacteraceae bacterium]
MTCRYCRAANSDGEHRCQRCGRRLDEHGAYAEAPYTHTATAPALDSRPESAPQPRRRTPELETVPGGATGPRQRSWQPSLFGTRDLGRVVSLDKLSGTRLERPPRQRTQTPSRPRTRKPHPSQQDFVFADGPAATPRPHSTAPPPAGVIWCDAPVAIAAHRIVAAALDVGIVVAGMALFAALVYLLAGSSVMHRLNPLLLIGVAAVLYLFYRALFCLADGDSPGMRWSHLRTVTFDGRLPEREQRFNRMAAACLSVVAMGLGLLWSLVDEEALTWHDHISRTFPTPYPVARARY